MTFGQLPSSYINREHVSDKIWSELPNNEKEYLKTFKNEIASTESIVHSVPFDEKSSSVYRDRLIKRGLIAAAEYGKVRLVLPRFEIFISKQD